jgi:DNA-binding MurR/RpiR family transcriptional regulator
MPPTAPAGGHPSRSDRAPIGGYEDARGTLLERFSGQRLSPVQRRIAQHILSRPDEVVFLSSVQLAAKAGVSQASVTRFAQALGFRGYPGLLRFVRERVGAAPRHAEHEERNKFVRAVADEVENLRALQASLADPSPLSALGRHLAASSPLSVLGLRASRPVAAYFVTFARKIHPDVRLVDEGGSWALDRLDEARAAGASWVLCFCLPRYPRETITALRYAREIGLQVASVTDQPLAPVSELSDLVLLGAVGTRSVFDSHAAPMTLAALLLEAMCDADAQGVQGRLEAFEHRAAAHRFFDPS